MSTCATVARAASKSLDKTQSAQIRAIDAGENSIDRGALVKVPIACSAYKSVVESHASSDLQLHRIECTLPRLTITSSVRSSHIRQIPTLLAKSQGLSRARRLEFFAIFAHDMSVAVPSNQVTDLEAMLCALDGTVDASTVADHHTIWHAHVIEKFERLSKANTT